MSLSWHVIWCKDCTAVGIVKMSPVRDTSVDWANVHFKEAKHTRIASLPFGMLKDLYQMALEVITKEQEAEVGDGN